MPVAAVTPGGRPSVSLGSRATAAGSSLGSMMEIFTPACSSDTTAAIVTSDPVPAVVGTA